LSQNSKDNFFQADNKQKPIFVIAGYTMGVTDNNRSIILIEGQTKDGKKFRPSDWAERMSGALSTFGRDQRIQYSPLLKPVTVNGLKCVAMDAELQQINPDVYHHIMNFVKRNELSVLESNDDEFEPQSATG
jgi:hypothetical protein